MSRRLVRACRVLIVILAVILAGSAALADSIEVRLNASAKIYQSTARSARYIKAPKGLRLTLKSYAKGWGKVSYKGKAGYVRLKYLDRVEPLKAYVTDSTTIYRDADGTGRLTTVSAGTAVYILGVDGGYVRVQNRSGSQKGYVRAGVLTSGKGSPAEKKTSASAGDSVPQSLRATAEDAGASKIEKAIFVAQNLIGAPYANDPKPPKTFDCPTFTRFCYGSARSGAMKNSSKAQGYDERYARVDYDHLKRGDLVCFDTVSDNDLSDHVGLYLGGGYFLHASSAAKKVILSSLSSGYYKRTFSWGLRIFDD